MEATGDFVADAQYLFAVEMRVDSQLWHARCDCRCVVDALPERGVVKCCNQDHVRVLDVPRDSLAHNGSALEVVPLLVEFCILLSFYLMSLQ